MANWYDDIPAPVDASGREVPLDTKELVFDGERREVYCFIYSIGRGGWNVGFKRSCGAALNACNLPDSWEQLDKDARKTPREYIEGRCIPVGNDGRVAAMARDLVRRAKALAGVSDGE